MNSMSVKNTAQLYIYTFFLAWSTCSYSDNDMRLNIQEESDLNTLNAEKRGALTRFLFTADPQFYTGRSDINDPTLDKLAGIIYDLTYSRNTPNPIFGLLVGGDMTQTAHNNSIFGKEFQHWKNIIKYYNVMDKSYETIGNHDETTGGVSRHGKIESFIDRNREYARQSYRRSGALYSWDVEEIHFVALGTGVFSSERPTKYEDVKNYRQLDFLQNDLDINVGNSGKKVVLMFHIPANHHDWKEADRKRFLNLIQEYNVVLLLAGHTHAWGGEQYITLPNGRRIAQVVAPTIRNDQRPIGQYADIKLENNSTRMQVELKHNDGIENYKGKITLDLKIDQLWYPQTATVKAPIYMEKSGSFNERKYVYKDVHYYTMQSRNGTGRCIGYDGNTTSDKLLIQVTCDASDPRQNWFWSAQTQQIHSKMDWNYCWRYDSNFAGSPIRLAKCNANDPNMRWQYSKYNKDQDWLRKIKPANSPNLQVDGYKESNEVNLYSAHSSSTQLWGVSHQRYPANQMSLSAHGLKHTHLE